jgi:hypothetical protein
VILLEVETDVITSASDRLPSSLRTLPNSGSGGIEAFVEKENEPLARIDSGSSDAWLNPRVGGSLKLGYESVH